MRDTSQKVRPYSPPEIAKIRLGRAEVEREAARRQGQFIGGLQEEAGLSRVLASLGSAGQSVVLTTLEDNSGWECSAIVGGKRYTAFGVTADAAARLCNVKVAEGTTGAR